MLLPAKLLSPNPLPPFFFSSLCVSQDVYYQFSILLLPPSNLFLGLVVLWWCSLGGSCKIPVPLLFHMCIPRCFLSPLSVLSIFFLSTLSVTRFCNILLIFFSFLCQRSGRQWETVQGPAQTESWVVRVVSTESRRLGAGSSQWLDNFLRYFSCLEWYNLPSSVSTFLLAVSRWDTMNKESKPREWAQGSKVRTQLDVVQQPPPKNHPSLVSQ